MGGRVCGWCRSPLDGAPSSARYCRKQCRQSAWRFNRQLQVLRDADTPRRLAFADPPYPGKAHLYRGHPDYAGEVDHGALLATLGAFDGWAMATSAEYLPALLRAAGAIGLAPAVACWVRGERHGRHASPSSSWEPVLYVPARTLVGPWPPDSLVFVPKARTSDPARVLGAKPAAYCSWVFGLLGARRGDTLADLFPGSGGVSRAWATLQEEDRP